jgi:hypothetical protein
MGRFHTLIDGQECPSYLPATKHWRTHVAGMRARITYLLSSSIRKIVFSARWRRSNWKFDLRY